MSLEAVHTCNVNPLLSPTLKRNPCREKKVIKHPPPPLPLSSLIFLSGRLYYLITIVTLHVDLSGMVYHLLEVRICFHSGSSIQGTPTGPRKASSVVFPCITSNFICLSVSTLRSTPLWRIDTIIFAK